MKLSALFASVLAASLAACTSPGPGAPKSAAVAPASGAAALAEARAGEPEFRTLFKDLIETNTTASAGSCTRAAELVKARLSAAGYPESDLHLVIPENPKHGNIVAELPGSDPNAKALLLLAHIDVVEANRADWKFDPFVLREEGGFFMGRGVADDKSMAAAFADAMIRFKKQGYKPQRTIKMALTCGEEGGSTNGVRYMLSKQPELLKAGLAINEGGGGLYDVASGKRLYVAVQVGEKLAMSYTLEVTNPGGHSSRPVPDNAIYRLTAALLKVSQLEFPVQFNEVTRGYFERMADIVGGAEGADMKAALTGDKAAIARLTKADPIYNATFRTTCVATQMTAGHAPNALPQRAKANVNCRIFPGGSPEEVRKALETAVNDPNVSVTRLGVAQRPSNPPPPLSPEVMDPIRKISAEMFPGVAILPVMSTGATDGAELIASGVPTYGVSAMFAEPLTNMHGLDERIAVASLYDGRAFLYRLAKAYAGGK